MAPHRAKGEEGRERGRGRPSSSASGKTGHSPTTLEPGAKRQLDLALGPLVGRKQQLPRAEGARNSPVRDAGSRTAKPCRSYRKRGRRRLRGIGGARRASWDRTSAPVLSLAVKRVRTDEHPVLATPGDRKSVGAWAVRSPDAWTATSLPEQRVQIQAPRLRRPEHRRWRM